MKRIISLSALIFVCFFSMAQTKENSNKKVAIMLYPGAELLDFSGPTDVFLKASELTQGQYSVFTVSPDGKAVHTGDNGPAVNVDYSFANMPQADIFVIPGSGMKFIDSLLNDEVFMSALTEKSRQTKVTMSVCTGAYLLAGTGRLNGLSSTTHFFVADDYAERFPKIKLLKDVRYVDNDSLITTSGVTSGIDGALHLVKKYSGNRIGDMVARGIQYVPHDKEAWPQAPKGMYYKNASAVKVKCAVCGMATDGKITAVYKGKTYYFCSQSCKDTFLKSPGKYAE